MPSLRIEMVSGGFHELEFVPESLRRLVKTRFLTQRVWGLRSSRPNTFLSLSLVASMLLVSGFSCSCRDVPPSCPVYLSDPHYLLCT